MISSQDIEKFWTRVSIREPDECWEWQAYRSEKGYGMIAFKSIGKTMGAHRISLMIHLGRMLAPGMCALHACDNPPCVNPRHLREGTIADNAMDRKMRGSAENMPRGESHYSKTHPEKVLRGERNGESKLTEANVKEAVRLYSTGATQKEIGKRFGVTQAAIWYALRGKTWTFVEAEREAMPPAKARNKLTASDVTEICEMRFNGRSLKEISARFQMGLSIVSRIINNKIWKHVPRVHEFAPYRGEKK